MTANAPEPLLDMAAVAKWLATPRSTLYSWRHEGKGPPAVRVGRNLRYRRSDVEAWLAAGGDDTSRPLTAA